ncbi:MAG: DUF3784 domain-containing protein [Tenuifilaceae bacterium]|jgi:hypothetical protein|nr:DUF3784 domain-containing protein [Tenuifilaceae bacterium]
MDTHILIVSVLLMALGFLVKAFPMLIAGYNTMSSKERAQVDIKGLSSLMRNALVTMGVAILLGTYLFERLGMSMVANAVYPLTIFGGAIIMVLLAQRYNHNHSTTKLTGIRVARWVVSGIMAVTFAVIIVLGIMPHKASINPHYMEIKGMYGVKLYYEGTQAVELADNLPTITKRTNGFSLGGINKGHFKLDGVGDSRLYLRSLNPPFIHITDHMNRKVILNFKSSDETTRVYNQLTGALEKQNRP